MLIASRIFSCFFPETPRFNLTSTSPNEYSKQGIKKSIGYANICSSVHDHIQNNYKHFIQVLVLKKQKRAKEYTKEAYVARHTLRTTRV